MAAVKKFLVILIATAFLMGLASFFVCVIYVGYYNGRVYPGVYVGNTSLAGLRPKEVKQYLENLNNRLTNEGVTINFVGADGAKHSEKFSVITAGDNAVELIRFDSDALAKEALAIGRSSTWRSYVYPLKLIINSPVHLKAPVVINRPQLTDVLTSIAAAYEDSPHNAGLAFPNKSDLSIYTIVKEQSGKFINKNILIMNLQAALSDLSFQPLTVGAVPFNPTITTAEVEQVTPSLPKLFSPGSLALNYINPTTNERRDWRIDPALFADWLEVKRESDNTLIVGLNSTAVAHYIDTYVSPEIQVAPQNAKFVMEGEKVKEFQGSRNGLGVDVDKTYGDLEAAFEERAYASGAVAKTVSISLKVAEPDIKTADVNNLGITDIVGVGQSTFYNSHANRIKNITTAVKRLNGVLIKPGEEFSANKYAGPYTAESGFLPEMVIKGNRIVPEIGGGMCQIGTTLFRMAMNSGMDITERKNHSLVVSYYSDPVNNNPGTDATLYDPEPDFKFLNDTGNYLLLQTDVDYKKMLITFTLWGKPDGRSGSYTHPVVSKWIEPPAETQNLPDTKGTLKPGAIECQAAFKGAVASFTYTRVTPSGQKIDRVFDSYYRPLPKICILGPGVSPSSTPAHVTTEPGAIVEPGQ